ncbi:mitochondrial carrier protein, partial [Histoplasma capsulatum]
VIKTRIQNRNFENPESGFRIVSSMIRNEGPTSFFKGLTPKLLMTGPKLVFSFWLAQTLIPAFGKVVIGDSLFAVFIGTSAAYLRIRREHREKHPDQPANARYLFNLGLARMKGWWSGWESV